MIEQNSLATLKTELRQATNQYPQATDKRKDFVPHLSLLILQIPSCYDIINIDRETVITSIKKIWLYLESIERQSSNKRRKKFINQLKEILSKPEYATENIFKEYLLYFKQQENLFSDTSKALLIIEKQLQQTISELEQLKKEKEEKETWLLHIEQRQILLIKEQENSNDKILSLQKKLTETNNELNRLWSESDEKNNLIKKLKEKKKVNYHKQKEIFEKIGNIINKVIKHKKLPESKPSKLNRIIEFSQDENNSGFTLKNKINTYQNNSQSLEIIEKQLLELQEEKSLLSKEITLSHNTIEKEKREKLILDEQLQKIQAEKTELEHNLLKLQIDLENLQKILDELNQQYFSLQKNYELATTKYQELLTQKNCLENHYNETKEKLAYETETNTTLTANNMLLSNENTDQANIICHTKNTITKLNNKIMEQDKKHKELLKEQKERHEKELTNFKRNQQREDNLLCQKLQNTEKQLKNLQEQITTQETQRKNLDDQIKFLNEEKEIKEHSIQTFKKELETLKHEITILGPQLHIISEQNKELSSKIGLMELQFDGLNKEKEDLSKQNNNLIERLKLLQSNPSRTSPQKLKYEKSPFFSKKKKPDFNIGSSNLPPVLNPSD